MTEQRLLEIGQSISTMWDRRDLSIIEPLYASDAVFVSPNPPQLSEAFGTHLVGVEQIMAYYRAVLEVVPAGAVETVSLAYGVGVIAWVWQAGEAIGVDTMLVGDDGLIVSQHVAMPSA